MIRFKIILLNFAFFLIFFPTVICAQKNEIGIFIGSSGYKGDIGNQKIGYIFKNQSFSTGVVYKNNINEYLSLRSSFKYGKLSANDSESENVSIQERNLNFKSFIYDLNIGFEFNFFKFKFSSRRKISTPYLYGGISIFKFNPMGQNFNGEWLYLQTISTEGQSINQQYKLVSWSLPFGFGYKTQLKNKLSMGIEWIWHKTYTDYLDDVSSYYPEAELLSPEAYEINYQNNQIITPGKSRGNPNNNDWFNFFGITFTYKIKNRSIKCPKELLY